MMVWFVPDAAPEDGETGGGDVQVGLEHRHPSQIIQ